MPELAKHLQRNRQARFHSLTRQRCHRSSISVAQTIDCEFSYLRKLESMHIPLSTKRRDLDVDGKIVAIVDDMIATGGTICALLKPLEVKGCRSSRRMFPRFVHGWSHSPTDSVCGWRSRDWSLRKSRAMSSPEAPPARGVNELFGTLNGNDSRAVPRLDRDTVRE